jgi:hypothetical protein
MSRKVVQSQDENKIAQLLNRKIKTGEDKYEFFQELERALLDDNNPEDDNSDYFHPQDAIGFTAGYEFMVRIDPRQIGIIQCVLRKDAQTQHVPEELEIRARPEDVAIVRYLQPR